MTSFNEINRTDCKKKQTISGRAGFLACLVFGETLKSNIVGPFNGENLLFY